MSAVPRRVVDKSLFAILRELVTKFTDPDDNAHLRKLLVLAEKGASEAPVYTMRH